MNERKTVNVDGLDARHHINTHKRDTTIEYVKFFN